MLCEAANYVKLSSLVSGLSSILARLTAHNSGPLPSAFSHCRTSGFFQTTFLLMAGASVFSSILCFISMSMGKFIYRFSHGIGRLTQEQMARNYVQ